MKKANERRRRKMGSGSGAFVGGKSWKIEWKTTKKLLSIHTQQNSNKRLRVSEKNIFPRKRIRWSG